MEIIRPDIHQILWEYWGYRQFRPLQQDIIEHVLQGKDALALLPTGGGKSICFQVPAMAMRGICIVISPLIALMQDQVEHLQRRGIAAEALYSGLSKREIELVLNGAVHGRYKFLYVSPERCQNDTFVAHFQQMDVCLLAVDEAHCVSQWGYDFRPPYLEIVSLRSYFPQVPLLALTATATPDVVEDIQDKLHIHPHKVFQKSFSRENLTYYVIEDEDKMGRLERIARKVGGCGIVYVRNRKKTADVAAMLSQRGIPATFYHAGLKAEDRLRRQKLWIENRVQVMVATNAFGMGIDKPDVRFVVHLDLPDTLEAYFQEAGRAGRDGKSSFAIMLYHPSDKLEVEENFQRTYPGMSFISRVYEALCNFYQIPVGCGEGALYAFDLREFTHAYSLPVAETYAALAFLERESYIRLSEQAVDTSKIRVCVSYEVLYDFQVKNPSFESLVKALLRLYGGRMFSDYVPVYESDLARMCGYPSDKVKYNLAYLGKLSIIDYHPVPDGATILFVRERRKLGPFFLSPEVYALRKENARRKLDAVLAYVQENNLCRNRFLLQYFGEEDSPVCGKCDVCLSKKRKGMEPSNLSALLGKIKPALQKEGGMGIRELLESFPDEDEDALSEAWQYLMGEGLLVAVSPLKFVWREKGK